MHFTVELTPHDEQMAEALKNTFERTLTRLIKAKKIDNEFLLELERVGTVIVEVIMTDSKTIAQLNYKWRKKNTPTDVLSFENDTKSPQQLGSIVICSEIAKEQAAKAGILLQQEIKVLANHGLLHLLGATHR